jgi:hypothetical protein
MSQAQPSEKKKWWYAGRPSGINSLEEGAMWHVDQLLGNGIKINNATTFAAWQQILMKQVHAAVTG